MLNILEKFDNVEIKNDTRLNEKDLKVIEGYQKQFDEFRKQFLTYEKFYIENPLNAPIYGENYNYNATQSYKMLEKLCENFMKDASRFISKIYAYFQDKYNVSLENNFKNKGTEYCIEYREKEAIERLNFYKNELNYNLIINDMFIQLDGFDFNSKAEQELKESTKIYCYNDWSKKGNVTIKNNKVTIDGYYAYKDSIWNEYRLNGDYRKIFTALYHFDNGEIISNNTELHSKYCGYDNEKDPSNFEKYEPYSLSKLKSIKFFKNGKLQLQFKTAQQSLQFAKEYLGYPENK